MELTEEEMSGDEVSGVSSVTGSPPELNMVSHNSTVSDYNDVCNRMNHET